jgi:hypothetical protein
MPFCSTDTYDTLPTLYFVQEWAVISVAAAMVAKVGGVFGTLTYPQIILAYQVQIRSEWECM